MQRGSYFQRKESENGEVFWQSASDRVCIFPVSVTNSAPLGVAPRELEAQESVFRRLRRHVIPHKGWVPGLPLRSGEYFSLSRTISYWDDIRFPWPENIR